MTGRILIVDDKHDMLSLIHRIITEETPHEVVIEPDSERALDRLRATAFDLVISDLKMPKMDGIALLEAAKKTDPDIVVVLMTAYATIETAVEATRKGADDYITKPFRRERILLTVEKAMSYRRVLRENRALREALDEKSAFANLVGASGVMKSLFERVQRVAPSSATVLITGPSGTGKELLARGIHQYSGRRDHKMVTVNCTAIPESVLESELFGHVKGAFTGAWKDKRGLAEEADGGTLFLDEIGDLSLVLQTKILRLLQEGEYKPVGCLVTKKADLRIVAATNQDLKSSIAERRFREDLYYRLNVIRFELPPLRDRREDIPLLAFHFLEKYTLRNGKKIRDISPGALRRLGAHDFPGNVRELENTIERGVIFCRGAVLTEEDLNLGTEGAPDTPVLSEGIARLPFRDAKEQMTQVFHRHYIESLLRECNGNISRAADKAGIQRQYLHRLMKESGVSAGEYRGSDDGQGGHD